MSTMDILLFIFAGIGAFGSFTTVLLWLEIRPVHVRAWFRGTGGTEVLMGESPTRKKPALIVALVLFALTWTVLGYELYLINSHNPLKFTGGHHAFTETISDKYFENQEVSLDGRLYAHCRFKNVTLIWNGTAPFGLTDSKFEGFNWIHTDSDAISETVVLLKALKAVKEDVPVTSGDKQTPIVINPRTP